MMTWQRMMTMGLFLALIGLASWAQVEGATTRSTKPRLYVPYSKLTLTDAQRVKVSAIQVKTRQKIKALMDQEVVQINALLTPEQLAALEAMHQAELAKRRAYAEKRRKEAEKEKTEKTSPVQEKD